MHLRAAALGLVLACLAAAPATAGAKPCAAKQFALVSQPAGREGADLVPAAARGGEDPGRHHCGDRPAAGRREAEPAAPAEARAADARVPRAGVRPAPRRPAERRHDRGAGRARRGGQGPIAPGPGQTGDGYAGEGTTSSTEEDAEHATVRKTHTSKLRRTAFGPQCPDFAGNVVTNISLVLDGHPHRGAAREAHDRRHDGQDHRHAQRRLHGRLRLPRAARAQARLRDRDARVDRDRRDRQGDRPGGDQHAARQPEPSPSRRTRSGSSRARSRRCRA